MATEPAHEGAHTNRLAAESSPYLLQHASNPVDWYPWGEEAFRKAAAEDKPIFLSIGYSACHWCHVMAHESFEKQAVAEILNRDFVSIKVDREERPDVDEIYMTAVQMMTGSGGWPLTVFLTPDLRPFYGGTYFPSDDRYGRPGFPRLLTEIAKAWKERRRELLEGAEKLTAALRTAATEGSAGQAPVEAATSERLAAVLKERFDSQWGGFGGAPKFPPSGSICALLRRYAAGGDRQLLEMATVTLDRMAYGGMYDQLGGGFHRYSVDHMWLVPHFEKMLYDNALLSGAYLDAYQVTGRELYRRTAVDTFDYVIREMTDASGGFHSAEDADSEGEEGKFYVWSRGDIMGVLGEDDGAVFCRLYGVTEGGNFEGHNILHVAIGPQSLAAELGVSETALWTRIAAMRTALLAVRGRRIAPGRDDKVLASWNGLMVSSLARGYQVLGEERLLVAAERAGRFILAQLVNDGELLHTFRQGQAKLPGYLDDYANVANALVDLYEGTFDRSWLNAADELCAGMVELFYDEKDAAFFFTSSRHHHLLTRTKPLYDGATPSGNAIAALALLRLARIADRPRYAEAAEAVLRVASPGMARNPMAFTHMMRAVDFYIGPSVEIAVVGTTGAEDTRSMLAAVRGPFMPNKVVAFADPAAPDKEARPLALLADRPMVSGAATVYVCENYACKTPLTDPKQVETLLDAMADTGNGRKGGGAD